jgi:hypothetical protein
VHQAITILQRLDPPRYPTINGINTFKAILGNLGNPPCKELDVGGGGVVIDWLPGIERLCRYVLKGRKTKGLGRGSFIHHVKPRASPAYGGIQWGDEGVIFGPPGKKIDCSAGPRKSIIFIIGPN